jgi:30S ribosomal protein S31
MGRGDKKTKKGKIFKGSYGNSRPKKDRQKESKQVLKTAETEKEE